MNEIEPDREDVIAINTQYGVLPGDASIEAQAYRYNLCQAQKLIRLYGGDLAPIESRLPAPHDRA